MARKLIVILGPTASGKTELAIKLAKKFSGEIVSADSRQVYKEMIIGTASPCLQIQNAKCKNIPPGSTAVQQNDNSKFKKKTFLEPISINGIPHYLLHIIHPNEEFNVAIYKKLAIKIIRDIQRRKKMPFLVGGTGLYIWAVINNLKFPKVLPQKKLRKELEKKSEKELFEIYKKLDPPGAKHIEKENKRRLIRAIEVCKVTGKSFWKQRKKGKPPFDVLQIGIKLLKEKLKEKIKKRVERMSKLGLEKEVKNLIKKYGWDIKAFQAIGYQEWEDYFYGRIKKEEVKKLIILHTLQLAKRQMTWFRRDKRVHWIKKENKAEKLIKKFLNFKSS